MKWLYALIYSEGTAALSISVSSLILAGAQTVVVAEEVGHLHPLWPWWFKGAAAIGYEGVTFGTGLVIAIRGGSGILWTGLLVFGAISSWMGFDTAMRSQIGGVTVADYRLAGLMAADRVLWIRAILTGAALPAQYLLAVAAGRQLSGAITGTKAVVTAPEAPTAPQAAPVLIPATVTAKAQRAAPKKTRPRAPDAVGWRDRVAAGESLRQVAESAGVSHTTVSRHIAALDLGAGAQ